MSLYKPAKSRFWHYDFRFNHCRFHGSTGCASKRDAERFQAEVRRKAALGEKTKPQLSLDLACGAWWSAKGQHLRSHKTVEYQLANLTEGLGKSRPLQDLTLLDIDGYISRRRADVASASVNREIELLRAVVRWCSRRYDAPEIEWQELWLKEAAPQTRTLSPEEEDRLFAALPASIMPIVEFALISGQRRAEVVTMRWSDVDLAKARATVSVKGGARHTFPLSPRLVAIIGNQPKVCPQVFTYVCERPAPIRKDRVLRVKGQRYPFSRQGWDRKWRRALKAAGVENFRFHDLRHTALTRLGNIETAFELAGHSDIRTTKRYFHTAEERVREAMIAAESRNSPEPDIEDRKKA